MSQPQPNTSLPTLAASQPSARPAAGEDLPSGPGVWERDGRSIRVAMQYDDPGPPVLRYENADKPETGGDVSDLPRGNWRRATAAHAEAGEDKEVERLRIVMAGCSEALEIQHGDITTLRAERNHLGITAAETIVIYDLGTGETDTL